MNNFYFYNLGSDNLIMGCGEKKITLWNVEYGHKIATIELSHIGPRLSTLWAKCDRVSIYLNSQFSIIKI